MNNKGFTLVELLATIVIIGVIMGIATTSVISTINKSKIKSEKVFVDKLETAIESYISINGSKIKIKPTSNEISFIKCRKTNEDGECPEADYAKTVTANELESFDLKEITEGDTKTISIDDIVNPKNKKQCLNNDKNPEVRLFKDSDYVYYYYVDLNGNNTSCNISEENAIITNIPKKLCTSLTENVDRDIKCDKNAK